MFRTTINRKSKQFLIKIKTVWINVILFELFTNIKLSYKRKLVHWYSQTKYLCKNRWAILNQSGPTERQTYCLIQIYKYTFWGIWNWYWVKWNKTIITTMLKEKKNMASEIKNNIHNRDIYGIKSLINNS